MSENYTRVQGTMSSKGINLIEKIKAAVQEQMDINNADDPSLSQVESLHISNEKFIGKIDWESDKTKKNLYKWSEEDMRIKDYFEKEDTSLPLIYLHAETSYDTSFKLSDQAIICIDKRDSSLKKINTFSQQIDQEQMKKFLKEIVIKKNLSEIMSEYRESQLAKSQKNKELETQSTNKDCIQEEISVVIPSFDKQNIILGTSQGGIIVLSSIDFKLKLIFNNPNKSRVTDVINKQNFYGVGYQNGSITIYNREFAFMNFNQFELKKPDDLPIRALKLFEQSVIAIHSNEYSFDTSINLQHDENLLENNQLILYNVKDMIEIGRTELVTFKCQNFELKKYFDFSKDCFIVRSPDCCSFRVHTLKNCQLISQGPDNIDASTIQFIKALPDQKHLLVVSFNGDAYFYDLHGQEVHDPSNLQMPSYMISPCGPYDLQLLSLPDRVQLFKFRKTLNSQLFLFEYDEQCLYFSDKKDSFIIQLLPIKPQFREIIAGVISNDQTQFFYTYNERNCQFMDIADLQLGTVLKTIKNYEPITTSFNSKFLYCVDLKNSNVVKINLSSLKLETIKEVCNQMIVINKQGDLLFYCNHDKKTEKYQLVVLDIVSKQIIGELDTQFDQEFSFQISNNEHFIILSTKDNQLLKINCQNCKNMKILQTIKHEPGCSPNISFDLQDEYFICGGEQSSNLLIYDLKTMNLDHIVHNHSQPSSFGYFDQQNRIVTKQNDRLIYWKWNGKLKGLELLFEVHEESVSIRSFNQQMAGFVKDNEISYWNEELTHEITYSLSAIQPNNLRKQWMVGPLVLVYQLILNTFYSVDEEEKIKMLPHLLSYTILPFGFTFITKLIFSNQNLLVKEAYKIKDLVYTRDINGTSPLMMAIKKKDFESLENTLVFLGESKKYISQIVLATWIQLIQLAPSSLGPFLDSASIIITDQFNPKGQKIDDKNQTYFEQDSQSRVIPEQVYQKLLKKADDMNDMQLQFSQSLININNQLGSKESILFSEALDDCPDETIFKNVLIDNMLKHKATKMKSFANFLLWMQVLFTLNVSVHSFIPGEPMWIHILSCQNWFWAIVELIIFVQSNFSIKYNSKLNIWLFFLLNTYGSYTLEQASPDIDKLLPLINWLAWFQLVTQLQQFELIRTFYCIFLGCIAALDGFCYFLVLMIFTFATTQDIILKNNDRSEKYGNDRGPYSIKFYEDHNITQTFDQNIFALWDAFFTTWVTIVKGDFSDSDAFVWRMFVLLSTFISNVVLLNLIIAFMSDSYGEVMLTIFEKKNKTLNYMTLRLEKVKFWKKNTGTRGFLIWADYMNEIRYMQSSKIQELPEIVEIATQKCLDGFLKDQKIMFSNVQTQIVQTRQKLSNILNFQQNFINQQPNKQQLLQNNDKFVDNNSQMINSSNQSQDSLIQKFFYQTTAQLNLINQNVNRTKEAQQMILQKNDKFVETNSKIGENSSNLSDIQSEKYFFQTCAQLSLINQNVKSSFEIQKILQKEQQEMKDEMSKTKNELIDHIAEQIGKTQIDSNNALNKLAEIQSQQINQLKKQINVQMPSQDKQELASIINLQMKKMNSQIVQELKTSDQNQEIKFLGLIQNFDQLKSNVLQSMQSSQVNFNQTQSMNSSTHSPHRLRQKQKASGSFLPITETSFCESEFTQKLEFLSQTAAKPETRPIQLINKKNPQSLENNQTPQQPLSPVLICNSQTDISQKFSQIQSKANQKIVNKFQNHEAQIKEFIKNMLVEIEKQIDNKDQNRQDQLQNLLSNLNQTQYRIMIEANLLVKNQGGNLQTLLTEQIVEIISQISQDIMLQLEQKDLGLKVQRSEKEQKQLQNKNKVQQINKEITKQQKSRLEREKSSKTERSRNDKKKLDNEFCNKTAEPQSPNL